MGPPGSEPGSAQGGEGQGGPRSASEKHNVKSLIWLAAMSGGDHSRAEAGWPGGGGGGLTTGHDGVTRRGARQWALGFWGMENQADFSGRCQ